MTIRLAAWWNSLVSTFWFLPGIMMALAIGFAVGMPILDIHADTWVLDRLTWLQMTPSGAQQVLASIAGAMVTVTGVVFSITIVTLSIATSQLGPRLLRTFMANLTTQCALGLFAGTSLYCLLVLATVRTEESLTFVPHLSVVLGVVLAVLCLGMLIFFTHTVAALVQAPNIVTEVARNLDQAVQRLFPNPVTDRPGPPDDLESHIQGLGPPAFTISGPFEGYIQTLDVDRVLHTAEQHDAIIQLLDRPGKFVVRDSPRAHVWWANAAGNEDALRHQIAASYVVGARPTPVQDAEGAINELVEVALRALSPSLNDPFTAMNCVDRIGASLSRLVAREIPPPVRRDEQGQIRVLTPPFSFPTVLGTAFNQIRQYGRDSVATTMRLLEALEVIAAGARRSQDREALALQAELIMRGAERAIREPYDLAAVRQRYGRALTAIRTPA